MTTFDASGSTPGASESPSGRTVRKTSFGQNHGKGLLDKVGIWLSFAQIRRRVELSGRDIADIGCGYNADFVRTVVGDVASATCVDIALSQELKDHPKIKAIEGILPDVLDQVPSSSLDVILCNHVLEHLWEPIHAVVQAHRILRPGGTFFVNVPSWSGKIALETAAFRLKLIPQLEIDDHKWYFTRRDLWSLLVKGGFKPSNVTCRSHKWGLNNYAICKQS